ncbi:hypothetical protein [Arsenicicoccus sp. oral taxon 190]|uniref:hypothetical protein n=1 Tax=Arsenicicoccus sp. oral taxon 190 TaxID=1658671 RepID=UPI0012E29DA3|nr:hypothetical protein [Arsenicicoccus sp. oral taxon 190]
MTDIDPQDTERRNHELADEDTRAHTEAAVEGDAGGEQDTERAHSEDPAEG